MEYRIDTAGTMQLLYLRFELWEVDASWPSIKRGNICTFPGVPGVWTIIDHRRDPQTRYGIGAKDYILVHATSTSPIEATLAPQPKRTTGMNYSTAIFLVNDKVRAVRGIYEAWDDKSGKPMPASTVFKTFDQDLKVGDLVLVPSGTRHRMTVNKIVEVDVEPDLESSIEMSWVIGVVDFPAYQAVLAEEAKMIKLMRDAEKADQRKKLREKVLAHMDESQLAALAIAKREDIDDGSAIAPNPAAKE